MVEYALILVLVAIAAITALGLLSNQISAAFGKISGALGGGGGGGGAGF